MKRFSNILFVANSVLDDTAALNQAVSLATNNQAKLTVVGTVSDFKKGENHSSADQLRDMIISDRQGELQELVGRGYSSQITIECKVLVGKEFVEVIREVLRSQHDLVIKSADPINRVAQLFGSADMKLLRKCPCPLWIINSTQENEYRQVLAAVDHDPADAEADVLNGQILEMATSIALADFAQLHIVHAWHLPHESYLRSSRLKNTKAEVDTMVEEEKAKRKLWLEDQVAKYCTAQNKDAVDYLKPNIHLPKGDARHEIPKLADQIGAELVVMGTVGRGGIPGIIIGNTAETILHQIACSVLAVKPADFVSPITL